jgi:hypothetical protein
MASGEHAERIEAVHGLGNDRPTLLSSAARKNG